MTDQHTDESEDQDETEESSSPWGDSIAPDEGSGPGSSSGTGATGTDSSSDAGSSTDQDHGGSSPESNPFEQASTVSRSVTDDGDADSGRPSTASTDDETKTPTGSETTASPGNRATSAGDGTTASGTTGSEGTVTSTTDAVSEPPPSGPGGGGGASTSAGTASAARADRAGETNTAERDRPEEVDPTISGAFGTRNYTQDLVDFEFVFDKDDSFTPDTVDSSGIIETPNGDYVGLAEVTARSWSIHTDQKKHEIIQSYQSGFLSTLDFYAQIVCYPTEFDLSEHVNKLEKRVREMGNSADEGDLIQIGRQLYPAWLTGFVRGNDLTQRDYYVVVRVDPTELRQFDETESFADTVAEQAEALGAVARAIEGLFSSSDEEAAPEASREECIQEVRARLNQVSGALQQIDVDVEPVDDRDEALAVVYHYYNNTRPGRSSFDTGTRTTHDPDAPLDVDENRIDDLLRPNYEPEEEEPQA